MTLDPAAVARFAHDLAAAIGTPEGPVALAVSGGADSMAMLALAHAALPGRVHAATVDHRLRADAAEEAAMVARWCATVGIPHTTLRPDRPPAGASIQAQARQLRYDLLGHWALAQGATALLTAHHADDQAETFLMRAVRGSGPAGLAGIRARWIWHAPRWRGDGEAAGPGLPVVRPLLGWRRATLRTLAKGARLPFVDDPANVDPRHDRTGFRGLLGGAPLLDVDGLARAARHCAESDAALVETVAWLERSRTLPAPAGECAFDMADLPRELRRRLVRRAIARVRDLAAEAEGSWSDAANIEPLLDALEAGSGATRAGVAASARGGRWHFQLAPPRRSP
ncbi:tRNA lysidine(34) synthetase TilS [Sphingomonas sp. PL-96]|uniref:tRNA lysidine(34) synthetase TilS n=1 Tax=Sphingomonas sp. PL-96 TaxID=2887201 RepID=UPI001E2EBB5F|nr:tRNA lysidine(34) synthetase TilS [Sphingomonas sp. PL-96]MCC2977554.1 tRNA lysidine(34) synthetase TilS [Sphingomonas sp. PL-96]